VELPGRLKTELFASVFEINTDICETVGEVDDALPVLRRAAARAAEEEGLAVAAAGTHPFARPEAQPIVKEERYVAFLGYGGISVRRQGVQGLHVHVGMPSPEDCWRCLDAILPWLPVVLALSANSPWFAGELTGMASNRAPILAELPRGGAPPGFTSYGEWEAWVERLMSIGVMEDYTRTWWDVRPHPKLGTLEVRVPDQPTDVRLSPAFAALIQAMCATALAGGLAGGSPRADYIQNRWAAARFGPPANLIHPDGLSFPTATELAAELLERVRPAAERLGGADVLARLDPSACEADRQLEQTDPREAAAALVARSLA
jgi:carboxylate-amine ligase